MPQEPNGTIRLAKLIVAMLVILAGGGAVGRFTAPAPHNPALHERVAVLEKGQAVIEARLVSMDGKLDRLLQNKVIGR